MSVLSGAYYAFTTDNDRNDKKEKLLKKELGQLHKSVYAHHLPN